MKTLLFTLSFLALVPQLATAQVDEPPIIKPPVVMQRVTYSRALPIAVRRSIPKGGTSRFWGATHLKQKGKQVWLHVYDVQKIKFPARFDGEDYLPVNFLQEPEDGMQKSGLDLWIQNDNRSWKFLSRVRFEYLRNGNDDLYDLAHQFPYNLDNQKERLWLENNKAAFETVGVQTFWLDATIKTKPILEVGFAANTNYGARFLHLWIVFAKGLDKEPVVQGFYTRQYDFDSLGLDFISTDQMGNVLVKYHHAVKDPIHQSKNQSWIINQSKVDQVWTLKWKGKGFVPDGKSGD